MTGASVFLGLLAFLSGRSVAAQTVPANQAVSTSGSPAYGTTDYTITAIAGLGFTPGGSGIVYNTSGSLARAVSAAGGQFFSALDIPAGAVIDFIGFNNLNDGTPNVMAVHLWSRSPDGVVTPLYSLDNTPHASWATDINPVPLGLLWQGNQGQTPILEMEIAPSSGTQYFASVEVWWKRSVSPAPATASFNDVPTDHPFFQFIEALKASGITGGCNTAPPLYCPDTPVTRGQMAVFITRTFHLQ